MKENLIFDLVELERLLLAKSIVPALDLVAEMKNKKYY